MSYKHIVVLSLIFSLVTFQVEAQIKVKPYRSKSSRGGNFGKYPTKVRFAPIISFGSSSANYSHNDSLVMDSLFQNKVTNNADYFTMGNGTSPKSHFGIGLMLDIPFSRHITFRPRIMYSSKTIGDGVDYLLEDSATNAYINIQADNEKKLNQLETMFIFNVDFGSDRKKTRFFIGGGFGLGVNMSATNNFNYQYVGRALDNPDQVYYDIDTTGTSTLSLGGNIYEDFFDRVDLMYQFDAGANIGRGFTISAHYNGSLGNLFTDPRFGSYTPYYYGVSLAYIFGPKPDLWGY